MQINDQSYLHTPSRTDSPSTKEPDQRPPITSTRFESHPLHALKTTSDAGKAYGPPPEFSAPVPPPSDTAHRNPSVQAQGIVAHKAVPARYWNDVQIGPSLKRLLAMCYQAWQVPRLLPTGLQGAPTLIEVAGASGSQGAVMTALLVLALERTGSDTQVRAIVRSPEAFKKMQIQLPNGQKVHMGDLVNQGRIELASAPSGAPANTLNLNMSSMPGFGPTINVVYAGTTVVATQNGLPPLGAMPNHLQLTPGISKMITKTHDNGVTTLAGNAALQMQRGHPAATYLQQLLSDAESPLRIELVNNVRHSQAAKLALNTTLNSLCTVFNLSKGELIARAQKDPRIHALIVGIVHEVCAVVQTQGITLTPQEALDGIQKTIQATPQHGTSMRDSFNSGKAIEHQSLSGAVARLGDANAVATPLCTAVTRLLDTLVLLRDEQAQDPAPQTPVAVALRQHSFETLRRNQLEALLHLAHSPMLSRQTQAAATAKPASLAISTAH